MQTLSEGPVIVVALVPGEEILESLREVADAHKIGGGFFTGLGSIREADLAFFDPQKKEYVTRKFDEPMEIGNLTGNISMMDDKRHVHCHASLCGPELIAFSGHLQRAVVGVGCEIYIRKVGHEIVRVKSAGSDFNPLKLT